MNRLKELRLAAELTQKQLADKSGVNLRTIQSYEAGTRAIEGMSLEQADKLSVAIGCSIKSLIEKSPN